MRYINRRFTYLLTTPMTWCTVVDGVTENKAIDTNVAISSARQGLVC